MPHLVYGIWYMVGGPRISDVSISYFTLKTQIFVSPVIKCSPLAAGNRPSEPPSKYGPATVWIYIRIYSWKLQQKKIKKILKPQYHFLETIPIKKIIACTTSNYTWYSRHSWIYFSRFSFALIAASGLIKTIQTDNNNISMRLKLSMDGSSV